MSWEDRGEAPSEPVDRSLEDKELALAYQAGRSGADELIYERYAEKVQRLCRRMLMDPHDAQEATQETFLRIYQALGRFNGRYQLGAWITRIASNVCLDHLRATSRKPCDASLDVTEDHIVNRSANDVDPQDIAVRNRESEKVHEMIGSLPPLHGAAIMLRDLDGLSYSEIALALDMSDSQVKALLHRARRGFKRSWLSSAAQALLPVGLVNRLRRVDLAGKQPAVQAATPGADIGASAAHMAASCSGVLQQCAHFFGERLAPAFTAVFVGAASFGAASAVREPVPSPTREPVVAAVEPVTPDAGDGKSRPAASGRDSNGNDAPVPDSKSDTGPESAPVPVPEPAPSPSPTPSPTPASGEKSQEGGKQAQELKPIPSPDSEPEEPAGFSLRVGSDLKADGEPCSCMQPTDVVSESVHATKEGLQTLSQSLRGTAKAGGTDAYGLSLSQQIAEPSRQDLSFVLYTKQGSYKYSAAGSLVSKTATSWGGWTYSYEGTYELGGRASKSERMPEAGRYTADVTISWRQERVVALDLSLLER